VSCEIICQVELTLELQQALSSNWLNEPTKRDFLQWGYISGLCIKMMHLTFIILQSLEYNVLQLKITQNGGINKPSKQ
jgi:hypothetical protein